MTKTLKILTIQDPKEEKILRKKSRPITKEELKSEDFKIFLNKLLNTALSSEKMVGVQSAGISAPQVGRNIQLFYILNENEKDFTLFINPKITILDMKQINELEGCLSIPNIEKIVPRYKKIKVEYQDKNGKSICKTFKNIEAREIQHEFDHLNGVLFIDRVK